MATRQQRLSAAGRFGGLFRNSGGTAKHMLVVYMDDPPPMKWSQDYYAKYAPQAAGATIDSEQLYPATPFMDWLATQSMQYTRATNTPVCSSGRASLHTGEYLTVHGMGSVVRVDRNGDLAEFGDSGYDSGTPLATSLASNSDVKKAYIGKIHLSLDDDDSGLEWTIMDKASGESGNGRLGDWDRRVNWLSNANQSPVPDGTVGAVRGGALSDGNVADDAAESGSTGTAGYYLSRYRDETQQRNLGTILGPGSGQGSTLNTNGPYIPTVMTDEAITFFEGLDLASDERGFCLYTTPLCHAPYDLPPPHLCPSTSPFWHDLNASSPSDVPIWVRQQAMAEAMDGELRRLVEGIPANVRQDLTIVVAADNGVDGFYMDSMVEDGDGKVGSNNSKDMGAHWTTIQAGGRLKSTLWKFGIQAQLMVFGPTVTAGTCDALVEVGPDLHETICAYFGVSSGTGAGVSIVNTWDGSKSLTNGSRSTSVHGFWYPHGSPDPDTQAEMAYAAAWATSTAYSVNDVRFNVASDGTPTNYVCTSAHTSGASDEPGVGASFGSRWDVQAVRDLAYTLYTTGVSGEAAGVWKLIRRLHDSGETNAATDLLFYTHDGTGAASDEYEETALDVTDGDYNATYAQMATVLDAFEAD